MRLIDADKLIDNLDKMILANDGGDYAMGIVTAIQEAGRMAYEDYIKVIPVEWIEKWFSQFYGEQGLEWNRCKRFMLEDWKQENEID